MQSRKRNNEKTNSFILTVYFLSDCLEPRNGYPSIGEFLDWVRSYHPVARQADITLEMGAMEVRTARGAFDPLLFGNLDQKTFKDTEYYDRREAGITVPTLAGVELMGTFEQNTGQFLNPEATVPSGGL